MADRDDHEHLTRVLRRTADALYITAIGSARDGNTPAGIITAMHVALFNAVRSLCSGMQLKRALAPEARDLADMLRLRVLFEEQARVNLEQGLVVFDRCLAQLREEEGKPTPHAPSDGSHDDCHGAAPSVEDLNRLFRQP